jgi:DNA topoisomerase-1
MRNVKGEAEKSDEKCEKCGAEMVIKFGRFGKFLACSGYPECKSTKNIDKNGEVVEKKETPPDEPTDYICPKCSKPMVKKHGRFGEFIACTDYPGCKTTRQIGIGVDCPKDGCKGELVRKMTKRRKVFFGCSLYPDCDFAVWDEPVKEKCPTCGYPFLVKKTLKKGTFLRCGEKECDYSRELPEEPGDESGDE